MDEIELQIHSPELQRRASNRGFRQEPLIRALGFPKGVRDLLDATAGLGREASLCAMAGFRVRAVERHPELVALWESELAMAPVDNLQFIAGDSAEYLRSLSEPERPEVVYIDPMFPPRKKVAKVKKDMQALQALIGLDADTDELLATALAVASNRVVLKRPKGAAPMREGVHHHIDAGQVRYDVYMR